MFKSQTAELLVFASAVDPIRQDELTLEAWHEVIGHLSYEAARAALREHRATSADVVKPAHILALAKKHVQRTDRGLARPPAPPGKVYAVDVIEYGELG